MTAENRTIYHFPVVYQKEKGGFGVNVVGLDNVYTVGPTLEEAQKNAREAIKAHLDALDPQQLTELEPYTQQLKDSDIKVEIIDIPMGM